MKTTQSVTEIRQSICASADDRQMIDLIAARVASSESFRSAVSCWMTASASDTCEEKKALCERLASVTMSVIVSNAVAAEALRMSRDGGRLQ